MATSKTLLQILTGGISYDQSWAIYAERINGEFKPESPARFGQRIFENGGVNDDCEIFTVNDQAVEFINCYTEGDDDFLEEAALELIQHENDNYQERIA
ncbi:hypothetical protein [Leptolyngbya ohadii]|uniref:hypothetical protein n=1 Tax=Leptolyngbya ohadii TaxID=1962290 RepID=UPI000B599504|nr:hypothetical protein [Leptolyngbya ohadii]